VPRRALTLHQGAMSTILRSDAPAAWLLASEWCVKRPTFDTSCSSFLCASAEGCCLLEVFDLRLKLYCSLWTAPLQAYFSACSLPASVHLHNYSAFAVRQSFAKESDVTFVMGPDAWSMP
jgi:hypothetical protein